MKIAYLMNTYPMTSTTFIRREILALERQGIEIIRIALRGWDSDAVDEEDRVERKRTRYVLRAGAPALLLAFTRMLLTRPIRLMQTLLLVWRMGRRAARPLFVHVVYLAEACRIEPWLRKAGVQHLHAHFGTNPAEVAMLVHVLGGPDWSFTVHGPEEFDKPQFIGLGEKIRHCSFVVAVSSYTRSQLYRWVEHAVLAQSAGRALRVGGSIFRRARDCCTGSTAPSLRGSVMRAKGTTAFGRSRAPTYGSGRGFRAGAGGRRRDARRYRGARYTSTSAGRVRITGWISSEQVRDEILAARALVLPSFAEGLPVVIMEAMALRRPVISTFVAGIPELVQPGEHGWLVPAGDVEALARAMQACLDTPADVLNAHGRGRAQACACPPLR